MTVSTGEKLRERRRLLGRVAVSLGGAVAAMWAVSDGHPYIGLTCAYASGWLAARYDLFIIVEGIEDDAKE
jgi:hypothetical protein